MDYNFPTAGDFNGNRIDRLEKRIDELDHMLESHLIRIEQLEERLRERCE